MSMRNLAGYSIAAIAGATMLSLSASPTLAFTLSGPSLEKPVVSAQIEKIWWDRWGRWHPGRYYYGYYGYGPLGVVGAVGAAAVGAVAGTAAVVGGAIAGPPGYCWRRFYNRYEGWHWRRVC